MGMKAADEQLERRIREAGLDRDLFLAPRRCLREPIPEIFQAATMLGHAVDAHRAGDHAAARALIRQADMPVVRAYTEMLWGKEKNYPERWQYVRRRSVQGTPQKIPKEQRKNRHPTAEDARTIVGRYGHNCVFCGMPVIRKEIRKAISSIYPDALGWGGANSTQHAAFQCMWLQYDHVFPWAKGGDSSPANVVVACAPCNYGRGDWTLQEVGVIDPRTLPLHRTTWDGLERFLSPSHHPIPSF